MKNTLDGILPPPRTSYGSVQGRLYGYSNRKGNPTAELESIRTGHRVAVTLSAELASTAKDYLDKKVLISGRLTRDPDTNEVTEVVASGIIAARCVRTDLPTDYGAGILGADWMGGKTGVELIREQRDAS